MSSKTHAVSLALKAISAGASKSPSAREESEALWPKLELVLRSGRKPQFGKCIFRIECLWIPYNYTERLQRFVLVVFLACSRLMVQ